MSKKQAGLKVNGAQNQFCMNMIKRNKDALTYSGKENVPEESGQNHKIKIGNKYFENVAKFKCFGTSIRNQNFIHEESKCR
jgi:hypothetical protein